jgi:HSP20 family protein
MSEREKPEKEREGKESHNLARWDPFVEIDLFSGWSPFREHAEVSSRLSRLLGEAGVGFGARGRLAPSVDIAEDDGRYVVTAELPGSKKDDVTVELEDNLLTICGEKHNEREDKKEQSRWIERTYGSLSRSFTLPGNAVADRVKADFKDGVLTIEIPKAEATKPRVISIK